MDSFTGISPHQPLSDPTGIRTIRLYPGRFDDEVRCELEHCLLQGGDCEAPTYIALSYTWGDSTNTKLISLDGKPYPVTLNLASFLRHMQTMLGVISEHLPEVLISSMPECASLRTILIQRLLGDLNFPQSFTSGSIDGTLIRDLVQHHFRQILVNLGTEVDTVEEFIKMPDNKAIGHQESKQCYIIFWIDSLCINQTDPAERSKQVARMKDIYSQAQSTLIWLGDTHQSDGNVDDAIRLVRDLYQTMEPLRGKGLNWEDLNWKALLGQVLLRGNMGAGLLGIRRILTSTWFSRAWIIQEVATAQESVNVLLGYRRIPWFFLTHVVEPAVNGICNISDDFANGIMVRSDSGNLRALREITKEYWDIKQTSGDSVNHIVISKRLYSLLRRSCGVFEATDPRDVLYSLLGLIGANIIPPQLVPNYESPVSDVFHQYTIFLVTNTNSLNCLSFYKKDLAHIPSWVPDWRYVRMDGGQSTQTQQAVSNARITGDGLLLEVEGFRLGTVVGVIKSTPANSSIYLETTSLLSPEEDNGSDEDDEYDEKLHLIVQGLRDLKRRLILNLQTNTGTALGDFPTEIWQRFWSSNDQNALETINMTEEIEELGTWINYKRATYLVAFGTELRRFSKTGLAILDNLELVTTMRVDVPVLKGDIVVRIQGAQDPCILRQDGHFFSFVGACATRSLRDLAEQLGFVASSQIQRFIIV